MTDRSQPNSEAIERLIEDLLQASVDYERAEKFDAKYRRKDLEDAKTAIRTALQQASVKPDVAQAAPATDLVKRLRNFCIWNNRHSHYDPIPLCQEAADELERLQRTEPQAALTYDEIAAKWKEAMDKWEEALAEVERLRAQPQASGDPPITDLMFLKQQSERLSIDDKNALVEFIAPKRTEPQAVGATDEALDAIAVVISIAERYTPSDMRCSGDAIQEAKEALASLTRPK